MMILPRSNRMVTPGAGALRLMLHESTACEERSAEVKLRTKVVLLSTFVSAVFTMEPVTWGLVNLFFGCS